MATIKRANVVLQVADDSVDKYLSLGYSVIDNNGNVVKEGMPYDVGLLQQHFVASNKKIAELEAEIARLKNSAKQETKKAKAVKADAE